jgi:hypothetical protein
VTLSVAIVVIPTKDRVHLLGRAVRSVLAHWDPLVDCVVIVDASSDATGDWLASVSDGRVAKAAIGFASGDALVTYAPTIVNA